MRTSLDSELVRTLVIINLQLKLGLVLTPYLNIHVLWDEVFLILSGLEILLRSHSMGDVFLVIQIWRPDGLRLSLKSLFILLINERLVFSLPLSSLSLLEFHVFHQLLLLPGHVFLQIFTVTLQKLVLILLHLNMLLKL